jgi:hypothetical protein
MMLTLFCSAAFLTLLALNTTLFAVKNTRTNEISLKSITAQVEIPEYAADWVAGSSSGTMTNCSDWPDNEPNGITVTTCWEGWGTLTECATMYYSSPHYLGC